MRSSENENRSSKRLTVNIVHAATDGARSEGRTSQYRLADDATIPHSAAAVNPSTDSQSLFPLRLLNHMSRHSHHPASRTVLSVDSSSSMLGEISQLWSAGKRSRVDEHAHRAEINARGEKRWR
jgi:hypothetical protein